jgi:hypothetical protein
MANGAPSGAAHAGLHTLIRSTAKNDSKKNAAFRIASTR